MAGNDELLEFNFTEIDDKEFELHLQHHGVEQPNNITGQDQLRQKDVVICGRLVEAVHGQMKGEKPSKESQSSQNEPCTLAIFEWYVHTGKPDRRIKFACIDISFSSLKSTAGSKSDPWVANCAPWGQYSLLETTKSFEKTKGWQPSINFGQEGIANAELAFVYDLKETVERGEQIYVDGCPLPPKEGTYFHPDRFSAVRWTIFENKGQKSGIPRYFRTAVLLNRADSEGERFTGKVEIKVKVSTVEDAKERVKGFLGLSVKDDPVTFNPALPPKTDRFNDKSNCLGSDAVNLEDEMVFLLFKNQVARFRRGDSQQGPEGE